MTPVKPFRSMPSFKKFVVCLLPYRYVDLFCCLTGSCFLCGFNFEVSLSRKN